MKFGVRIRVLGGLLFCLSASAQEYQADWKDLDRYPQAQWLNEAKFGMYWCWNLASVPGIDGWYAREMYNAPNGRAYKHHVKTYGDPADFGYKDFTKQFTGEGFSAERWVEDAERVGVKFIVGMSAHHCGFDMYDSSYTQWDSVDQNPHIDVMGELEKEARKRGLKFGVTSHLAWNWKYFSSYMYPDKFDAKEAPDLYNLHDPAKGPSKQWVDEWYHRIVELIDNYSLDFLWFDFGTGDEAFHEHNKKLTAYYYNKSVQDKKVVALATKTGFNNRKSQVYDVEHGKFGHIRYPMWMADCTFNQGWFNLNTGNDDPERITGKYWLYQLIDMVSKNGTLLLSIGPQADGAWPEPWRQELFKMGAWLKLNGEAVYGTQPWHRYGEGPTHDGTGEHYDLGRNLTKDDVRFTRKDDVLYATVCGWHEGAMDIQSLGLQEIPELNVESISLIGSVEKIQWTQKKAALSILFPKVKPCEFAYVFKIQGDGLFPKRRSEYIRLELPTGKGKVSRIRVSIPGSGKQLALAELIAVGRPPVGWAKVNLAALGTVQSSSELVGYEAKRAFDKNYNGHPSRTSVFKSRKEDDPWIDVTFTQPATLSCVEIFGALQDGDALLKDGIAEYFDANGKSLGTKKLAAFVDTYAEKGEYLGVSGNGL